MIGTPQSGAVLQGRYRIVGLLGQGAMGRVLKAEDRRLPGRLCAIKEMIPPTSYTPQSLAQARQQFQVEAQILAKLDHPNLPKVSDYFTEGGRDYLVMDFVEGRDLEEIMDQTPGFLPEGEVVHWAGQICDALEYLHSRKPKPVIHRDIKPANVKLTPEKVAKLVDFGTAKLYDAGQRTVDVIRGFGTPGYAPLEQYGQGRTDARTDIYALGATLYHLLTGQLPTEIVERTQGKPLPSIRSINPQVSRRVEDAVLKAMSPKLADRFQSAAEFKRAVMGTTVGTVPAQITCAACGAANPAGVLKCASCGAVFHAVPAGPFPLQDILKFASGGAVAGALLAFLPRLVVPGGSGSLLDVATYSGVLFLAGVGSVAGAFFARKIDLDAPDFLPRLVAALLITFLIEGLVGGCLGGVLFGFGFVFALLGVVGGLAGALISTRFIETEMFRKILVGLQM